jgi:glycerol-3-phosphate cytidylyltransferase
VYDDPFSSFLAPPPAALPFVQASRNVLVIGVFDLFHRGHVELLRTARFHGDRLVVAVNGDDFTAAYKRRPLFPEADRAALVAATRFVDEVMIAQTGDAKPIIEKYGINVIVHGDDWPHDSYMQQIQVSNEYVRERGIEFVYTPYYKGTSTSQLIAQIKAL